MKYTKRRRTFPIARAQRRHTIAVLQKYIDNPLDPLMMKEATRAIKNVQPLIRKRKERYAYGE